MHAQLDPAKVPSYIYDVLRRLHAAGHQAYLVGGCVRDMLLGRVPHDWDVATDARPERVQELFPATYPQGIRFGTVGVLADGVPVEVTTFRREMGYDDHRRPSVVAFSDSVLEDLARRDFTMNAIAWDPVSGTLVDPYGGCEDIAGEVIRAVGDAEERFREDALRMLRAVRFAAQVGFTIEPETWSAIEREAFRTQHLSQERIRDELLRLLAADRAGEGLWLLQELGLLRYVLPELMGTDRMLQGKPGAPTLLAHLIQTVDACPPDPVLRLAALLHDVGKLTTRSVTPEGRVVFHGHEVAGEEVARAVCRRLRLSKEETERVATLVRMHMVQGPEVGKKALRRWLTAYGEAWVRDLIALRRADHVASGGDPDDNPFADRLSRELEEVLAEGSALTVRDLAVSGHDVMAVTGLPPGPAVGSILRGLLERVLEDPTLNERETLLALAAELAKDYPANARS